MSAPRGESRRSRPTRYRNRRRLKRTPTSSPTANPVSGWRHIVSIRRLVSSAVAVFLCASALFWLIGSSNPATPAGYVGYLTKGAVFGQSRFYGVQRGPTSAGRTWLLHVTNVSITPYTYTEDFIGEDAVLSCDNLKI